MTTTYIVSNPQILGGKPIIKGTRISVQLILEWLATGGTIDKIVEEFPHIPRQGIVEALIYASKFAGNEYSIEVENAATA
jgi:uncharacterized protein (DUF433 family)